MIYSLNLTPEEMERIEEAKAAGINVDRFLKGAISSLPASTRAPRRRLSPKPALPMPQPRITQPLNLPEFTPEKRQAAIAYFEEQAKSVITDPEEIRQAEADFQEMMRNLREWR